MSTVQGRGSVQSFLALDPSRGSSLNLLELPVKQP